VQRADERSNSKIEFHHEKLLKNSKESISQYSNVIEGLKKGYDKIFLKDAVKHLKKQTVETLIKIKGHLNDPNSNYSLAKSTLLDSTSQNQ